MCGVSWIKQLEGGSSPQFPFKGELQAGINQVADN